MSAPKNPITIGLVGIGKIVIDQHFPSLLANKDYAIVAGASRQVQVKTPIDDLKVYPSLTDMMAHTPDLMAVSLCTPPGVRFDLAVEAINHGKHVFLEKPPAASLGEAQALKDLAAQKGVSLLASWHSRFAPAVETIRQWGVAARA